MHWGPYSVPGVASEWFWYQVSLRHPQGPIFQAPIPHSTQWNRRDPANPGDILSRYMNSFYPPDFTYQQFGPHFRAEFFNATE